MPDLHASEPVPVPGPLVHQAADGAFVRRPRQRQGFLEFLGAVYGGVVEL
jgi:hypothetical protein